jgi:hypothetical protein
MTQVYIGLGPRGHSVSADDLGALVANVDGGAALQDSRGTFATFAASSPQAAEAIIQALNGHTMGDVRLVARLDRGFSSERGAQRGGGGGYNSTHERGSRQAYQSPATTGDIFVGLGPNGRDVSAGALTQAVAQIAKPLTVNMHPSFAIVTVDPSQAQAVIDGLQGQYIGSVRLSLRPDRRRPGQEQPHQQRHEGPVNGKRLYIGLGPNGSRVPLDALRAACEAIAPVANIEAARFCAFVDVTREADGQAIIDGLTGTTLHGCRLVVRHFRD